MKNRYLKLTAAILAALTIGFTSCNDDDEDPKANPTVDQPSEQSVQIGNSIDITFAYTAEAGFASSSVTATGGTATVTTDGTADATSGNIVVSFTASTTAGAGSVTLTVTDKDGNTGLNTAVLSISNSPVPSIAGVSLTATVTAEDTLETTITVTMEDVPGTLAVTANGVDFETYDITTDGQTVNFEYPTTIEEANTEVNLVFTATDSDSDIATISQTLDVDAPAIPVKVVGGNIEVNTTWDSDTIYELGNRVTVLDGITLTIEAGTVIKGQPGTGANATALLVARGGMLMAQGTATDPIIFTSTSDLLIPGQINSPNLTEATSGTWGGVLILGNAPISPKGGGAVAGSEAAIEGIPADDENGRYGGTVADDNSGTITYISIRHAGTNIGEGNEINGLTLGGVGSGTTISHVEIIANQDDGIEFFGGNVDVSNALVWANGDDAIDGDQAWNGTIDNGIIIEAGDKPFELDGPEADFEQGNYTISNFSIKVADSEGLVDNDDNTNVIMDDIFFFDLSTTITQIFDTMPTATGVDFTDFEIVLPTGSTVATHFPDDQSFVTAVDAGANTVGADKSEFTGWTFADANGQLADF